MIGNDIVDLKQAAADSNWRRQGYLQKIFTPAEQQLIVEADRPDVLVWLLWSMKEAAYKVFSREIGLRNFAPSRIACSLQASTSPFTMTGEVVYEKRIYLTNSNISEAGQYIHSLAVRTPTDLKRVVIEIAANHPQNHRNNNPASVSHHGRYLALAFLPLF